MFLITDFTASPARTYELNDINDACDVILGITNDMEIAEEAGSVMGRMTFGHEYTRLSYFSVRCVMDGNNADSVTGRKAKEPEKKYMLMEVIERDISEPVTFNSLELARAEMARRFGKRMEMECSDYDGIRAELGEDDYDNYLGPNKAFGEMHGQNFDWKILEY